MLKIWKQTWRNEDQHGRAKETAQSEDHSDADGTKDLSSSSASLDAASSVSLPAPTRSKRPLAAVALDGLPKKKARTGSERPDSLSSDGITELVVFFERLAQIPLTPLYRHLHRIDDKEVYLRRYFSAARHVLVEVGACASELVWRRAAAEIEASIVEPDEDVEPDPSAPQTKERLAKLEVLNSIKHWDFSMPNLDPSSRGFNVTPKFLKLAQILKSCQPYSDDYRGLVIVRKKAVAQEMVDLIRTVEELDFLRPQLLVGRKSHENHKTQSELFELFESGTCNLIFATKRAEDLDIPPATVVVRYDLFDSHISYGYSRARANTGRSHLVHMVPRNSDIHRRRLTEIVEVSPPVKDWLQSLIGTSAGRIPPRTIRETNDPYISDSEDEDTPGSFLTDPTTSGRIRLQNAVGIIYRFASTLPRDEHASLFEYEEVDGTDDGSAQYTCTVRLPGAASVSPIVSPPSISVAHARRTACYLLCRELFQRGLLDYHLFPRPFDSAAPRRHTVNETGFLDPDDADATASLPPKGANQNASGTRCYPAKSPEFWKNVLQAPSERLYPTVVCPVGESNFAPMLIVTRMPLPPLSDFNLFDRGIPIRIHLRRAQGFDTDERQRYLLWRYTTRVIRTIQNKAFTCEQHLTPYFLAPLCSTSKWATRFGPDGETNNNDVWNLPTAAEDIPWDLVELAADKGIVAFRTESLEALEEDMKDAVIQDRWIEFTRRYYVTAIRKDLTPLNKPEAGIREQTYETFLAYVAEHRRNFDGIQRTDQPMIEVSRVHPVQNLLHPTAKHISESTKLPTKYLIPELCVKSTLPASTFRTALLLPSVTHKIDALLLVKEINATLFDNSIDEHQLLSAICAPAAGMEHDYERLELLGDAYLKYLSSVYVFVTNPSQHEGALHSARLRIISNKALLINGDNAGLPPFIQSKAFVAKLWQPVNFVIQPQQSKKKEPEENTASKSADQQANEGGEDKDLEPGEVIEENPEKVVNPVDTADPVPASVQDASKSQVAIKAEEDEEAEAEDVPMAPAADEDALPIDELPLAAGEEDITPTDGADKRDPPTESTSEEGSDNVKKEERQAVEQKATPKRSKKKRSDLRNMNWLGDKAVADVAEAIIGAAYKTGGREVALRASKALCIAVPRVDRWADFAKQALAPPPEVTGKLRAGTVEAIEKILGHRFARPHLLAQALTHASIQGYEMTCYERLEFIGDAILDFTVIRHIYDRDTTLSPGALTLLKGAMVSNSALAAVCVEAGLHEHIMFESLSIANSMDAYAVKIKAKQKEEYELAAQEKRKPGQYWLDVDAPKIMSDVVESVIGAIYISDNFKPEGCITFYDRILKPFFDKHITLQTLAHHPTKTLFELFQTYGCQRFEMIRQPTTIETNAGTVSGTMCEVIVHDILLASGEDLTSANSAKRTSLYALDALEGDAGFMARTCDCRAQTQAKRLQKKSTERALLGFGDEETDQQAAKANEDVIMKDSTADGEKAAEVSVSNAKAGDIPMAEVKAEP